MKPTARGTLAVVVTGVGAVIGAAAATPVVAARTVPVPAPLDGAERGLNLPAPEIAGQPPVPMPGSPEGPRYVGGRLLPAGAVPQLPVSAGPPGADVRTTLPHVPGKGFGHLGLDASAADLATPPPGLSLDAPLTAPNPEHLGMPDPKLLQDAVLTPPPKTAPKTAPEAGLGTGMGMGMGMGTGTGTGT
ncbi:hypothetical protein ABZV34_02590 [Streptomyces sp. NPDC005195]|uniref:hypothetical protein n=1 Tax=Streptomyces sp. NPDC005195 TaxID=3154561 RepID=UPI0033A07A84